MTTNPVTPAEFGALVTDLRAELAETEGLRRREFFTIPRRATPDAWKGRPWVRQHADRYVIAELAGMAPDSVADLDRRARQLRREGKAGHRPMPASEVIGGKRQWVIGEIALWLALRDDRRVTPVSRKPPPEPSGAKLPSPTDEELLEVARRVVREHGPAVSRDDLIASLRAEGVGARSQRVAPLLMRARIEHVKAAVAPTDGAAAGGLESRRTDGLVTSTQVAATFGVEPGAITHAVERKTLTPVKYDPWPLFDPRRLAVRKDGTKGPVDVGHRLAVDMHIGD